MAAKTHAERVKIAAKGGRANAKKHSHAHFVKLGKKGAAAAKRAAKK